MEGSRQRKFLKNNYLNGPDNCTIDQIPRQGNLGATISGIVSTGATRLGIGWLRLAFFCKPVARWSFGLGR